MSIIVAGSFNRVTSISMKASGCVARTDAVGGYERTQSNERARALTSSKDSGTALDADWGVRDVEGADRFPYQN
jgi:hypothetical protein